jgi:hypothetical protein
MAGDSHTTLITSHGELDSGKAEMHAHNLTVISPTSDYSIEVSHSNGLQKYRAWGRNISSYKIYNLGQNSVL